MPVYHFIFHSYGSWMPDRPEGYFKHDKGWRPPDEGGAKQYHEKMQEDAVILTRVQQQELINEAIKAQPFQRFTLYSAATDSTHVHIVVAWKDDRNPVRIRSGIKSSLSRAMNARYGKQARFVAKAGQHPVRDEQHLSQLVHEYLPKHTLYWYYKSKDTGRG